jgi:hypothetical protein
MSYAATVFSVKMVMPADVQEERRVAVEVIHQWNAANAKAMQLVLMLMNGEAHAAPEAGERPTESAAKQTVRDSDLLVGVFWTRLGLVDATGRSGAVEEIQEHLAAGKPAMIYFSATPVRPDSVDGKEYEALQGFKRQCQGKGLMQEFNSPEDLRGKLSHQLQTVVHGKLLPQIPAKEMCIDPLMVRLALSQDAEKLLVAAAKADGEILVGHTSLGLRVQAGGMNFCKDKSARETGRWEAAVRDLLAEDLCPFRQHHSLGRRGLRRGSASFAADARDEHPACCSQDGA